MDRLEGLSTLIITIQELHLLQLHLSLTQCACLLTNLERSLLQVLAAEESKVTMVSETIHLNDALQRHVGLSEQSLNLHDTLLLHPAVWRVVELLLEHVVEVLYAESTDVGKLLNSLHAWRIIAYKRRERLVAIEEIIECA